MNRHIQAVPKQSVKLFKVLTGSDDMSACDIAEKLKIMPNTVYRAITPLLELGMVEKLKTYPITYRSNSLQIAQEWYVRAALRSFHKDFGTRHSRSIDDSLPSITFIKDREALRDITEQLAGKAKEAINFVTSGHRVADSTIDAYRRASARGVRLRAIIDNDPTSKYVDLQAYELIRAETKFLTDLGIRLFIFDKRTAVLTSYDPSLPHRAFGICFHYVPVAEQLTVLFEQYWAEAKTI